MASSPSPCTSSILDHRSHTTFGMTLILTFTSRKRSRPVLSKIPSTTNTSTPTPNTLSSKPFRSIYSYVDVRPAWSLQCLRRILHQTRIFSSEKYPEHTQHRHDHNPSSGRPYQVRGHSWDVLWLYGIADIRWRLQGAPTIFHWIGEEVREIIQPQLISNSWSRRTPISEIVL